MDVERSSLCNCVVNFLLQEKYHLTAFELLHELLEDGRHDQAIRLREFFSDPNLFPSDQISRFNSLRVADPQILLEEKETVEENLAISEYELRLAQEDLSRLKEELQKQKESLPDGENGSHLNVNAADGPASEEDKRGSSLSSLGPLKDAERKDINCAVKEYLLFAGYRLTAMTFIEEVTDQDLGVWPKSSACVSDALRRYYYQYLSATTEAAEEKMSILRENESLAKENERLNYEKDTLLRNKELVDGQIVVLTKTLETAQKDLKDREILLQSLRKTLEHQRKELNDCRAEITSLKMHIEGSRASRNRATGENENVQLLEVNNYVDDLKSTHNDTEKMEGADITSTASQSGTNSNEDSLPGEKVVQMNEEIVLPNSVDSMSGLYVGNAESQPLDQDGRKNINTTSDQLINSCNGDVDSKENAHDHLFKPLSEDVGLTYKEDSPKRGTTGALESIQILSDALPKIVPYVLINHREELLPLIMCAIERHPDSTVRDSLTHTLFNLIKRPDEQQRRIIMDACVTLAKNVGEMRTETELLPQCWEQINHTYEERRLLVAQSCGELAEFVRPEIRDSLILSIVQQLIEDAATVVREAAAHNLALLLQLFPNRDKYFKVEELMFQLVCDPSGLVVETTLKELVPAVITWGGKLDHILRVVLSHILGSAQRCPPLSGVEGSVDSHLRVLGERERWNIDVLLRMLMELLPFVHQKAIASCPFTTTMESLSASQQANSFFSTSVLQLYAGGHMEWPQFDWMYVDCFPDLIQLSCMLPQKEDNLRTRITKFLLDVNILFGDDYVEHIMLPVFLVAIGDCDSADLTFFPPSIHSRIKGLRPKTATAERLAIMCVLPLLLSGILGARSSNEQLSEYLRKLLVNNTISDDSWSGYRVAEVIDAVRFLCTFEKHHGVIFNVLWDMVVSSNADMKIEAANLLKVLVPYVDAKVASTQVLPALVTLGSDQNLDVKYASINTFGAVAQYFKDDMIVEKIRIQMDAFLEDGSLEATISVIRALVVAVPHTTERLREYLLSKIFQLTALPSHGKDVVRRREKANVFCEAVRALDATDLPLTSVRDLLIPAITNLLKDPDSLDPAHKEALEIIMKERSAGAFESISKVMGAHLGIATSVTSFFGEGGLRGKKDIADPQETIISSPPQPSPSATQDGTRFQRMMRGGLGEMLRGKGKGPEDSPGKPA
ncbi:lisH domain and HEAT repeat-containing protein KIAA1468 homolog [Asparagus officinalis]|uniref:lisH domain and HEAT repeat-containing protein KIAA1468 homolog n=1 Tax=Asparagus officinalis TaxID=4686 RepID=UPI00098E5EEF|nr:lisH domain and HEAT repeat-containing protein KIAA1468 homolog [Asparagus officinalis]